MGRGHLDKACIAPGRQCAPGTGRRLLPNVFQFTPVGRSPRWRSASAATASTLAEFPVRTLASSLLPYEPTFVIEQSSVQEHIFHIGEAKTDLQKVGRAEQPWPPGIDGARIALEPQGKVVISSYGTWLQLVGH